MRGRFTCILAVVRHNAIELTRSKHTRPRRIIAATRVLAPYERRGADDTRTRNRLGLRLKHAGIILNEEPSETIARIMPLPRIILRRPREGFFHPAGPREIRATLAELGPEYTYGVRSIALVHAPMTLPSQLMLGRLQVPGTILLYEQPLPPWRIRGRLTAVQIARLVRAGAVVQSNAAGHTVVEWPDGTLCHFMLRDVLLHEIAHHTLQHYSGKRLPRIARTKDHEAFARRTSARVMETLERSL